MKQSTTFIISLLLLIIILPILSTDALNGILDALISTALFISFWAIILTAFIIWKKQKKS